MGALFDQRAEEIERTKKIEQAIGVPVDAVLECIATGKPVVGTTDDSGEIVANDDLVDRPMIRRR